MEFTFGDCIVGYTLQYRQVISLIYDLLFIFSLIGTIIYMEQYTITLLGRSLMIILEFFTVLVFDLLLLYW
jgi:hypothetical protein